ncbi:glycosyltransferase [Bordetella genomosp. 13]|uniref:glycosyltransferase n=1 Tax=Bordetella genomosp. 13 TaxID=463040 RepID=UPI0011A9E4A8|nr:glycosyltransferase [Bordetella genomosp. 13]
MTEENGSNEAERNELEALKAQIDELETKLANETADRIRAQEKINQIYASKSWQITAPLRKTIIALRHMKQGTRTVRAKMPMASARMDGPTAPAQLEAVSEYEARTRAQAVHFRNYAKSPSKQKAQQIANLLALHKDRKGVVLCVCGYDLALKQRPDHIMSELAKAGYLCIMVEFGGHYPTIRKTARNIFVSNMIEDFLAYFSDRPVIAYVHAPGFKYVMDLCKKATVIYDVLDDLKIFAEISNALVEDHAALLRKADVCLFSAQQLLEVNKSKTRHALLLENGVQKADFIGGDRQLAGVTTEQAAILETRTVVGYHGVVSDLLDFDVLEQLVQDEAHALLMVGPVAAFDNANLPEVERRVERLKKKSNFVHLGAKPYGELKHYLAWVDVGIVPFIVSEKTDPVSPLKLFEYLAAGKPVVGTPTRTIRAYGNELIVAEPRDFAAAILSGRWKTAFTQASADLATRHEWPALNAPLISFLDKTCAREAAPAAARAGLRRVDIVNINFYDWDGKIVYKGGAERYVYDLAVMLKEMGCEVRLIQNANAPFERDFHGIPVVGLPASAGLDWEKLSSAYADFCKDADLVIASPTELSTSLAKVKRVISINHGIHWDTVYNVLQNHNTGAHTHVFRGLQNSNHCVCVDTNFINWVRSYDWRLATGLTYIPNYVDTDQFKPTPKDFSAPVVRVLLPRRLYDARGLYLTINAFDSLFERRSDIHLTLCGQASYPDTEKVQAFVDRHPGRVDWIEYDMQDMHKAYVDSHIALVPSMFSEGTSLSGIEALATNNAVIATNIGGLPNIITDGYNGRLIQTDAWELADAIEDLVQNRQKMAMLAANGLHTAEAFSKKNWEARWKRVLESMLAAED